ncbi:hypothetical protein NO976_02266 [Planktothrix agardhii]|jgi:hypothetical protein|uniref:hypothetical protein n=1 Tax=Planktothrix agardhii TaxID=1160 RepID=UPI001D09A920|nr:hypothetical protein [Planktothrix agardhii]MCB8750437.1 hypothetical protein [Planktothrix agardhii 1810]MCF3606309.1 hypothetical protein [Planktothrix agardhii 1033]CAD5945498.1 hypothetical protein NO976_02266 [Planktothrix agardhii]
MTVYQSYKPITQLAVNDLKEEQLQKINPKVVVAIQAIQAERMGKEPIAWSDFSSHTTN